MGTLATHRGHHLCLAAVLLAQETPRGPLRWRSGLAGAGFIVLGWTLSTGLLPLYISFAGPFSPALGSLGGGLILLTWLYLLLMSLLLGAEINAVRRAAHHRRTPYPVSGPARPPTTASQLGTAAPEATTR